MNLVPPRRCTHSFHAHIIKEPPALSPVTMNDDRDDYTLVPFPCIVSQYCVSHTCVSQRHAHLRFVHRGSFRSVPCGPVWKTLMCGDDGTPAYPSPTVHA